ncbi:MAG: HD domain-containing protein [Candidatus Nealsonbacteria bacterium]|nr:HD domain-containing protein [Candidatus Nealsonbacteria bacterium]
MENKIKKLISFLRKAGNMKTALRFSENKGMPKDSAASHSWRTSLMCFLLTDELGIRVDLPKVLKMAIVHDIVESIVGNTDYVLLATNKVSESQKKEAEKGAIEELADMLPELSGLEIYNLWNEYEEGKTREAKFVKAVNKLETLIYLSEVGYRYYDRPKLIFNYADEAISDFPELAGVLEVIKENIKKEFKKGNISWEE